MLKRKSTGIRGLVGTTILFGLCLFGGIGTWSIVTEIHGAVVAGGVLKAEGNRQTVQHDRGGTVEEIRTTEGDLVTEGDILVVLDDTNALASIGVLESQLANQLALDARLQAELRSEEKLVFPREFLELVDHNQSLSVFRQVQEDLFQSNRSMRDGKKQILRERLDQIAEQISGIDERLVVLGAQEDLLQVEFERAEKLHKDRLLTDRAYFQLRRELTAISGDISSEHSRRLELQQQTSEIEERILQVRRDLALEITEQRQSARQQISDLNQRLTAARVVVARTILRAPVSGKVVGMDLNTIGAVLAPAETVLEIVPAGGSTLVEVHVRPDDREQVSVDQPVRVRLNAYPFRSTNAIEGEVIHISADSFVFDGEGHTYYEALVRLSEGQLAKMDHIDLKPGMQAQVMILTEKQSVFDYVVGPILHAFEGALRDT